MFAFGPSVEASGLIGAVGLVLCLCDQEAGVLTPALALGYSNDMVTRLRSVPRDATTPSQPRFGPPKRGSSAARLFRPALRSFLGVAETV